MKFVLCCVGLLPLCTFADVVVLENKVIYILPPSGNGKNRKRHVYITDDRCGAHLLLIPFF
jgi:hypothetical protein